MKLSAFVSGVLSGVWPETHGRDGRVASFWSLSSNYAVHTDAANSAGTLGRKYKLLLRMVLLLYAEYGTILDYVFGACAHELRADDMRACARGRDDNENDDDVAKRRRWKLRRTTRQRALKRGRELFASCFGGELDELIVISN